MHFQIQELVGSFSTITADVVAFQVRVSCSFAVNNTHFRTEQNFHFYWQCDLRNPSIPGYPRIVLQVAWPGYDFEHCIFQSKLATVGYETTAPATSEVAVSAIWEVYSGKVCIFVSFD